MSQHAEPRTSLTHCTTREVFEDHLAKRAEGQIESDIRTNFADEVVLLTGVGIFHGHDGVRKAVQNLKHYPPDATYAYRTKRVSDTFAFLEWHGDSPQGFVCDGADSIVIRDGKIAAQTIHYTVTGDDPGEDGQR